MNLSNFTYYNMMYFSIVFEERNLSKAADRIMISRQALSKSIASLEQTLGKKLFIRKQNGVEPTQAALELITHVRTILREYDQISSQSQMEQMASRRVTIYTIDAISQVFPNSFYEEFYEQHPNILLTIEEQNEDFAIKQLLRNQCEFAVVTNESNYYDFDYTYLFHGDYGFYMSEEHPLAKKEDLQLADFGDMQFVGKSMVLEYYSTAVQAVHDHSRNLDFFLELTNPGKRRDLVRGGKFCSCAWNYNVFNEMNDGVVFRKVPDIGDGMDIYLIENRHLKKKNKNAQIFKKYLIDWIDERREKK